MFFKPSIKEDVFPVLDVGPGALPFEYSDVWLDFVFDEQDRFAQSGHAQPATGKPTVYYRGGRFPFKDKAFRYVVASHVLEHIPWEDIPLFLSELQRVASAGYIELPRWTYELINNVPEHISTGDVNGNVLHVYKKDSSHQYNFFTAALMEKSANFRFYVEREKELYFCRLEWMGTIPYELHESGYVISRGMPAIISQLKSDCGRLLLAASDPVAQVLQALRSRVARLPVIRNLLYKKETGVSRRVMSPKDVVSRLSCPQCAGTLEVSCQCASCGFWFEVRGKEYWPTYVVDR